jgi:hypothetical protein
MSRAEGFRCCRHSVRSMVTTIQTNCQHCGALAEATFNPGNAAGGAHWKVVHEGDFDPKHEYTSFDRPNGYSEALDRSRKGTN